LAEQLEAQQSMSTQHEPDPEILAITTVYSALKELDAPAQMRVIDYVLKKLNLAMETGKRTQAEEVRSDKVANNLPEELSAIRSEPRKVPSNDEFTGISPVAQKWLKRNGLRAEQLNTIFSLGGDEIDLVANKVPGKSTRARMRNVFLLKGVAAYLGGGAPRFTHDKVRETCGHYAAYDSPNFSKNVKEFAPEVAGSKESGYTLTARGLANAADLLKEMLGIKQSQ